MHKGNLQVSLKKKPTVLEFQLDVVGRCVQSDEFQNLSNVKDLSELKDMSVSRRVLEAFNIGLKAGRDIERFANMNAIEKMFDFNSR